MYRDLILYQQHARKVIAYGTAGIALCAFTYAAFMLLAVERTASRAAIESQIQTLSKEVADAQSTYLSATEGLTPLRAQELGFVTPSQIAVVYTQNGLSLRNTH